MSDKVTKISMLRDEVLALSAIVFSLAHIFTIGWSQYVKINFTE